MQIDIDTTNLPPGLTQAQVYAAVESSLMVYLGEFAGHKGHEEQCRTAAHVWKALIKPTPPAEKAPERVALDQLNSKDLAYLRLVSEQRNGHNDYQPEWRGAKVSRTKLQGLKLVNVNNYPAAGMGDVATTVCDITVEGQKVLRRARA